mmetsp:Transcript_35390/g.80390  ORF Transcript_35390/g.80390 Transcript_35390/m.80390 type:complete len:478 (+) Transcript_35390:70-1503(+)
MGLAIPQAVLLPERACAKLLDSFHLSTFSRKTEAASWRPLLAALDADGLLGAALGVRASPAALALHGELPLAGLGRRAEARGELQAGREAEGTLRELLLLALGDGLLHLRREHGAVNLGDGQGLRDLGRSDELRERVPVLQVLGLRLPCHGAVRALLARDAHARLGLEDDVRAAGHGPLAGLDVLGNADDGLAVDAAGARGGLLRGAGREDDPDHLVALVILGAADLNAAEAIDAEAHAVLRGLGEHGRGGPHGLLEDHDGVHVVGARVELLGVGLAGRHLEGGGPGRREERARVALGEVLAEELALPHSPGLLLLPDEAAQARHVGEARVRRDEAVALGAAVREKRVEDVLEQHSVLVFKQGVVLVDQVRPERASDASAVAGGLVAGGHLRGGGEVELVQGQIDAPGGADALHALGEARHREGLRARPRGRRDARSGCQGRLEHRGRHAARRGQPKAQGRQGRGHDGAEAEVLRGL